jgi:hypothetical protein
MKNKQRNAFNKCTYVIKSSNEPICCARIADPLLPLSLSLSLISPLDRTHTFHFVAPRQRPSTIGVVVVK